jgi:hypothetical protein
MFLLLTAGLMNSILPKNIERMGTGDMVTNIGVLELKLEKSRQLKQGIMHNLLIGKPRLL